MTKDEALDLALEALETELAVDMSNSAEVGEAAEKMCEAITAIKQARSAPVQDAEGENKAVRSFLMLYGQAGLTVGQMRKHMAMSGFKSWPAWVDTEPDGAHLTKAGAQLWIRHLFALEATPPAAQPAPVQEPADGTQVSKVWWDGEKLMAKPISLEDFYQPARGCTRSHPHENMDSICKLRTEIAKLRNENERVHVENRRLIDRIETIDVPPAAQRQWVGLTDEEILEVLCIWPDHDDDPDDYMEDIREARAIEAKLREKNT